MYHKYIWIPPKNKFNCKILQDLDLVNIYSFEIDEILKINNSGITTVAILFISNLEDIGFYQNLLIEVSFLKVILVTDQSFLMETLSFQRSIAKKYKTDIYCLYEENHVAPVDKVNYFTNNLNTFQITERVDFFWPHLKYSIENFIALEKQNLSVQATVGKKINLMPFPIYNSDACAQTNFSTCGDVLFAQTSTDVDLSIIVAHYENQNNLVQSITSLSEQLQRTHLRVEIIIVDDGSQDAEFIETIKKLSIKFIQILSLPRLKPRQMGDCGYRAGIARNFGAENANSEYLLFMDCDILIGVQLVEEIFKNLSHFDLIMPQRLQLNLEIRKSYSAVNPLTDVNELASPYWNEFYSSTTDWQEVSNKWKYVSTYCLDMKKDIFFKYGQFSPSFVSYGCEDVDLGYKFDRAKLKFKLMKDKVFHQQPLLNRSEFAFSHEIRKKMLLRAYFYLYQIHQDLSIYETLIKGQIVNLRTNPEAL
jgi:glycosyltransferase involved in cell wall biosynthesis